jgi:hypothetical protein
MRADTIYYGAAMNQDRLRDEERIAIRQAKADQMRGSLKIKTPSVKDEKKRARWYGMPPTELSTAPKWRAPEPF